MAHHCSLFIGPNKGCIQHRLFIRDRPDLAIQVTRETSTGPPPPQQTPTTKQQQQLPPPTAVPAASKSAFSAQPQPSPLPQEHASQLSVQAGAGIGPAAKSAAVNDNSLTALHLNISRPKAPEGLGTQQHSLLRRSAEQRIGLGESPGICNSTGSSNDGLPPRPISLRNQIIMMQQNLTSSLERNRMQSCDNRQHHLPLMQSLQQMAQQPTPSPLPAPPARPVLLRVLPSVTPHGVGSKGLQSTSGYNPPSSNAPTTSAEMFLVRQYMLQQQLRQLRQQQPLHATNYNGLAPPPFNQFYFAGGGGDVRLSVHHHHNYNISTPNNVRSSITSALQMVGQQQQQQPSPPPPESQSLKEAD